MLELLLAAAAAPEKKGVSEVLLGHILDGYEFGLPGHGSISHEYDLHQVFGTWMWHGIDFTPTKFTCMVWFAALVLMAVMWLSMRNRGPLPKGRLQNGVEMLYLFIRDEVAGQTIEHDAARYVPYLATTFFFILAMNLSGLIPYASTPTGNLNVTFVLAAIAFVFIQVAGMRRQGVVGYWMHLVPTGVPWWLYPLMIPLEILGLFTKPFALMMRLFANMLAGHVVIFFLIGLIFFLKTLGVAFPAVGLAIGIVLLEFFIAFLQAYVFTILTSLFIGMASHAH